MVHKRNKQNFNFNLAQINSWWINYNQYIQNKIKKKLRMKQQIMHVSNWKKKPLEVLKRINRILSTLLKINLPRVPDEEKKEINNIIL